MFKKIGLMFIGFIGLIGSAFATVPTEVGTALASVETDALALVALVWPYVLSVFGAVLLFKIFKRVASKI